MTTDLDAAIRAKLAGDHPIGHCPGCESGDPCDVELGNAAARAVIAVLDLHRRHNNGLGYGSREPGGYGHVPDVCGECGKIDEYAQKWPCPTVHAIAGKLGVEVDGG